MNRSPNVYQLRDGEHAVFLVLILFLALAVLTGAAVFARVAASPGYVLEIVFGLCVAVFLGSLMIAIVRKAALTLKSDIDLDRDEDGSSRR
jgi:hypothetical protein